MVKVISKKTKKLYVFSYNIVFYVQFNIDYSSQDILLMNIETIRPSIYSARVR